ncbi:hypothetical protein Lser_V15G28215 [Lactuca serriola]
MATKTNKDFRKGCKCKKSKCVKLTFLCSYCDCFAGEFYCGEDCSCTDCFNRVEYEDTVEVAREKIKVRDPLAFDPKIHPVVQSIRSHNEGGNQVMPVVGKHRKGCTCKNSMCFQLYCECYKANVGCSVGCRCEGCKNGFGIKGEYNVYNAPQTMRAINEKPNDCENTKLELTRLEFSPPESGYLQSSTPLTSHGNDTSRTESYINPSPISAISGVIGTSTREFDIGPLNQQSYSYVDQSMDNQLTPGEINEMLDWNPNETLIYTTVNNTTQYIK